MTHPATPAEFLIQAGVDEFTSEIGNLYDELTTEGNEAAFLECLHLDFRFFLFALWRDRGLHRVAPLDRPEFDMAHFAQHGAKKRGVVAPRGCGKTNIITAPLPCFRLLRDVNRRVLIPSKSEGSMVEVLSIIKGWLRSVWFLQHLNPERGYRTDGLPCRDRTDYFDVNGCVENKQPSIKAIGNEGQLEGNRAHTIVPDDVETKKNTKTLESRVELARLCKEYVNILYPDLPDQDDPDGELLRPVDPTEVCFVGTVKHEDTLYAKLDATRDGKGRKVYTFRTWFLAYPTKAEINGALAASPMIIDDLDSGRARPGDPVFPRRFGEDNILEKMAEGYEEYMKEHQQQVTLAKSNRYPLRLSDLIVMDFGRDRAPASVVYGKRDHVGSTAINDIPVLSMSESDVLYRPANISPEWGVFSGTKAVIDPAGRGTDKLGVSIVAELNGMLFIKACKGLPGGVDEDNLNAIAQLCRLHNATDLWVEGNIDVFGTFIQLFGVAVRRHFVEPGADSRFPGGWMASVSDFRAAGQKEVRIIETIEPVLSTHRLVASREVIEQEESEEPHETLQYQLSRITRERKCLREDGKLDSLASCIFKWEHSLRADPAAALQRLRAAQQARFIREHEDEYAAEDPDPSWITQRG